LGAAKLLRNPAELSSHSKARRHRQRTKTDQRKTFFDSAMSANALRRGFPIVKMCNFALCAAKDRTISERDDIGMLLWLDLSKSYHLHRSHSPQP
jgi:hypothetical protein